MRTRNTRRLLPRPLPDKDWISFGTMRPLPVFLLSLAACGGVNTGQQIEHPAPPEAVLGRGFDSLSGRTRGPCVEPRPVERVRRGVNKLDERIFYARTREELLNEIGYSGGLNFGIFGVGINLGVESLNSNSSSATTSFLVVRIQVESPSETLQEYRLKKHALETLRRDGPGPFYETCGDGFIAAIRQGGSFLGIIAIDGTTQTDVRRFSGNAGASFLGIGVSGGMKNENQRFLEQHHARYFVVQEGGSAGATSVESLQRVDELLARANRFKQEIVRGQAVPTRIVVEPYQVSSNRPRRAELWSLHEERRLLGQLAIEYGELRRAHAEIEEKLAASTCKRPADQRYLERLQAEYAESIRETRERAEDCVRDPKKQCTDRRLSFVDSDRHNKAMALCPSEKKAIFAGVAGIGSSLPAPVAPPPKPGIDSPCRLWQFTSMAAQIAPSKPGGAPWDGDNSPPEVAIGIRFEQRHITFAVKQAYSTSGTITDGYIKAGTSVKVSLVDRDALFDDSIAVLQEDAPQTLPDGAWRLESGKTSVILQGRCVE